MNTQTNAQKERHVYEAPEVVVYGNVAQITRQFGAEATDVPEGTTVSDAGPGGVTGDLS